MGMELRLLSRQRTGRPPQWRRGQQARDGFEMAWRTFSAKRTEADYQAWRDSRDWHARKYDMWERGELLPSQKPNSMMRCAYGESFDSHDPAGGYAHCGQPRPSTTLTAHKPRHSEALRAGFPHPAAGAA